MEIGRKKWAIAEGYIPSSSTGASPQMESHETVCILNAGLVKANIEMTIYYSDKDPVGPYLFIIEPQRTKHIRFNDLEYPKPIPRDTDFASVIISDVPVVVQHTRLDSRQAENALLSTIAYSSD